MKVILTYKNGKSQVYTSVSNIENLPDGGMIGLLIETNTGVHRVDFKDLGGFDISLG